MNGLERGSIIGKLTPTGQFVNESVDRLLANTITLIPLGMAGTRHGSVVDLHNIISRTSFMSYGTGYDRVMTKDIFV